MLIPAARLSAALAALKPAVNTRSTLPILGCVLLTPDERGLTLRATNLELSLQVQVATQQGVTLTSPVAIPYAHLTKAIGYKDGDLSLVGGGAELAIHKADGSSLHLTGMDADDFPPLPEQGEARLAVHLSSDDLPHVNNGVMPAAAKDESRPALAALHIVRRGDWLYAEAADGFRLGHYAIHRVRDTTPDEVDLILPAWQIRPVLKNADRLSIYTCNNNPNIVSLAYGQTKYREEVFVTGYLRLVDATFPDLAQIIPDIGGRSEVKVTTNVLTEATRLGKQKGGIELVITADGDEASATCGGAKHELPELSWNHDSIEHVNGHPVRFALNTLFTDWLTAWATEDDCVRLSIADERSALLVKQGKLTAVVMPMVIGSDYR